MIKRFIWVFVSFLVLGSFSSVHAQGFIKALKGDGMANITNNKTVIMMPDGSELGGKMASAMFSMGALKSFSVKDDAGAKTKYKAEDVAMLRVKVDKMMKLELFTEGASIVDFASTDFDEVAEREYIIFERALMPGKKQKYRLLQIVNPGFDSRFKVYYNPSPNAKESKGFLGFTGGKPKSYLVVKDGTRSIKIKSDGYKKGFEDLYADCAEMLTAYPTKKTRDWEYFPEHIFVYDQTCKQQ